MWSCDAIEQASADTSPSLRRLEKGRLKHKLFQHLTEDVGSPRLREHLASVVALMRASDDWDQFMHSVNRALPKYKDLPPLLKVMEESQG